MIKTWQERLAEKFMSGIEMQLQAIQQAMQEEIDELRAALAASASAWISVDERLPDGRGYFLAVENNQGIKIHFFTGQGKFYGNREITHWMPLPAPPGEQK